VALVTGGGTGIGAAVATRLAAEGAAVVVMGRTLETLQSVVAAIARDGGRAVPYAGDVTDGVQVEAAVALAVERFGGLDFLVTSHGSNRDRLVHKMTEADWDVVVDAHLKGTFLLVKAAQAAMTPRRFGRIVLISSMSVRGSRGQLNYSAAKAGLIGMARTLAIELGPSGILVNAVVPGFIDTDMTRRLAVPGKVEWDEIEKNAAARTAVGRIGRPQDVAGVIAFLCSDDAAFLTGQAIAIRGGP
jgi:3-oxoacyl-[acyl-carrier protein] reductase